jgi:hypothetical protein
MNRVVMGRMLRGLGRASAVATALQQTALSMDPGSPLRLPGFWDRVVLLVVGIILIGGLVGMVNALRRRADKRDQEM